MKKAKTTRHALLMSVLSMMLCMAMLVSSTFAWFTDSVTSGNNRIIAGNLDVELYYKNASTGDWKDASAASTENPNFFVDKAGNDILWEPGVMAITQFKVANVGSLALKYTLETIKSDFNALDGHDLSEVIRLAVIKNAEYTTREQILALEPQFDDFTGFTAAGELYPEKNEDEKASEEIFTVVAYWEPSVKNDDLYNVNNQNAVDKKAVDKDGKEFNSLYIDIEIQLKAIQCTYEEDSFSPDYDAGLWIGGIDTTWYDANKNEYILDTPDKLAGFAKLVNDRTDFKGKTITLSQDINLNNVAFTPIGSKEDQIYFNGTFDGNNKVISGLNIPSGEYGALFGAIKDATVKNLTVKGSVSGNNGAGIVGRMESGTIENCTSYVNVSSSAKAGGIVCLTNKDGCAITQCNNYGNVNGGAAGTTGGTGGIVAYANPKTVISGCNNYGNVGTTADKYSGGIVGYGTQNNSTVSNCVNYGTIVANNAAGGIAGMTTNAWEIINCRNEGSIDSTAHAGGIAGAMQNGKAENCKNTAPVNAKIAGGIVGVVNGAVEIINCSGGNAQITSPAWTLGFTGHALTLDLKENEAAGRLIGANGGGGQNAWTKLTIDDSNGDATDIGAVGICGLYTTWANLEIVSGTLYGDPVAGNTTYIKLDEGAVWADRAPGTYSCGGVTETIRKTEWTKIS